MSIFCKMCNKDFTFNNLPIDKLVYCPDCGSPVIMVNTPDSVRENESSPPDNFSMAAKTDRLDSARYTISHNRRKALILSSVGVAVGIIGISHLYLKKRIKGISFLVGGFFVYLLAVTNLNYYHLNRPTEDFEPGGEYGFVFFFIVYSLIWLWQFYDIRKIIADFH
jgi:DNA-directed RNA polymerase subunit RPC12/RpoP